MAHLWYRVYYVLGRRLENDREERELVRSAMLAASRTPKLVRTVRMSYNDAYIMRDDQSERNRTAWIEED